MESPFATWVTSVDDAIVMHVGGDIDVTTSGQLLDEILLHVGAAPRFALDLAEVVFLDSSGVSALIAARQAMLAHGSAFAVRNPSSIVRRVLDVTGLSNVFNEPTPGA